MRIAYNFVPANEDRNSHRIELIPSSMLNADGKSQRGLCISFDEECEQLGGALFITAECSKVLTFLVKEGVNDETNLKDLYHILHSNGARQVVFDERLNKYRNCTTMKDDDNSYSAADLPITVTATDEETAKKRIRSKIARMMTDSPENAMEYAKWFQDGCKVVAGSSGKCPEYTPITDVIGAQGPIKVKAKQRVNKRGGAKK